MRSSCLTVASLLVAMPVAALSLVATANAAPYTIERELNRWMPVSEGASVSLSPDGKLAAVVVKRLADQGKTGTQRETPFAGPNAGSQVFVIDTATGKRESVSKPGAVSYGIAWSPDSRSLAYYSDADGAFGLWAWDRDQSASRKLHAGPCVLSLPADLPQWSPDGRLIVFKVAEPRPEPDRKPPESKSAASESIKVFEFDPARQAGRSTRSDARLKLHAHTQLIALDVRQGTTRTIAAGRALDAARFSPDGRYLSAMEYTGSGATFEGDSVWQLVLWDLRANSERIVVRDIQQYFAMQASWSADSRRIAYATSGLDMKSALAVIDVRTGRREAYFAELQKDVDDSRAWKMGPVWSRDGKRVLALSQGGLIALPLERGAKPARYALEPRRIIDLLASDNGRVLPAGFDERTVIVSTWNERTSETGHARIDLTTGESQQLWESPGSKGSAAMGMYHADVARDGSRIAFVRESAHELPEHWVAEAPYTHARKLTDFNAHLSDIAFGRVTMIDFLSADGLPLRASLLLPPDYKAGTRVPLIVDVYPGPKSSDGMRFGGLGNTGPMNRQLLATRGYAVLTPDSKMVVGHPVDSLARCILPAVLEVIDAGTADPAAIGLAGHSQGAMSVVALTTRSTIFKAAIGINGYFDLYSFYGTLTADGRDPGAFVLESYNNILTSPWKNRRVFEENSPLLQLDRVQTPILLVYGTADVINANQSDEVFVGLRRLGRKVSYVRYEGEGHVPYHWSTDHQIDLANRTLAWFDEHLKRGKVD